MIWVIETPQVHVTLCDGPAGLVARDEAHPYLPELMLGLAASIIEDGRFPADAVQVYTDGLRGVAVYYEALVARDPSARHPTMDALVALMVSGVLRAEVARRLTGCGTEGMGVDPSVR